MTNVVRLDSAGLELSEAMKALLETVKSLEEAVLGGTIVGFAAVGIESTDITRSWTCGPNVSRLRMMGVLYSLLANTEHGQ